MPSPLSTKEVSATLAEYLPAASNMKLNIKPLLEVPFHVVERFRSRINGESQRTTVIFLPPYVIVKRLAHIVRETRTMCAISFKTMRQCSRLQ